MKFKSQLTEGVLLKRYFRFLLSVGLSDRQKLIIRCPTLAPLPDCDILGSRLWFTNPIPLTVEYLHTWELVEVDGGALVCVNPEHALNLCIEGIKKAVITELQDFITIRSLVNYGKGERIDILLTKGLMQTFVMIQPIIAVSKEGVGFYPDTPNIGTKQLLSLEQYYYFVVYIIMYILYARLIILSLITIKF